MMTQESKLKQVVFEMFKEQSGDDLLVDAPQTAPWTKLAMFVMNKHYWRARVRVMKQPRVTVDRDAP